MLAIAGTGLIGWELWQRTNFAVLGSTLRHANLYYLIPILAILSVRVWLRAVRWRHLVSHIGHVSVRHSSDRVVICCVADTLLPFQLGYFATVQLAAVKFGLRRLQLFGTDLMERMSDGLAFAVLMAIAVGTLAPGKIYTGIAAFMLFGTLAGFMLGWLGTRRKDGLLVPRHWPLAEHVHHFLQGFTPIQHKGRAARLAAATLAIWVAETGLYWLAGLALGFHVNPLVYVFLVAASNLGASIPFVHASVGFVFLAEQAFLAVGRSTALSAAYALSVEALLILPLLLVVPVAAYDLRMTISDLLPWRHREQALALAEA